MKDEDLHELFSNLRTSVEASHMAQTDLLDLVEALVETGSSNVVIREIEAEPASEPPPCGRQALQRSERTTISVEEAGKYLGIGRAAAYLAVKNGELPSLRLGSRILVPVWALLELLAGRSAVEAPRAAKRR